MSLTQEQVERAVAHGRERAHEREYENARQVAGVDRVPPWSELTEPQRVTLRALNKKYWREMNALGESIRGGDHT